MWESRGLKTLGLLFDHARSSNDLPWLPPRRSPPIPLLPPLFSESAPSAASPLPPLPVRSFLSSLLPQDVWSRRAFNLKGLYSITWPNVALSMSSSDLSAFFFNAKQTGHETGSGGSSISRSPIDISWTNVLLTSNVLAYGAQIATGGKLLSLGSKNNYQIARGQLWRLVTPVFLHADIGHLLVNCYSLHCIGPAMETLSGPGRFLTIYFTSAVASSAMSYRFVKASSIGASGAIAGLNIVMIPAKRVDLVTPVLGDMCALEDVEKSTSVLGAYAVYVMRHRDMMSDGGTEALHNIAQVIAINLAFGIAIKGIDNWGHLGGFLGGAAMAWFIGPALKYETRSIYGRRVLTDRAPISYILDLGRRER